MPAVVTKVRKESAIVAAIQVMCVNYFVDFSFITGSIHCSNYLF